MEAPFHCRSALFVPGSNLRAIEKASFLFPDIVVFDLEDSVGDEEKGLARSNILAALTGPHWTDRRIVVRVNSISTPFCVDDFRCLSQCRYPLSVMLPKLDSADDVKSFVDLSDESGLPDATKFWAIIETARSVLNPIEIADSSPRIEALVFGHNDLQKSTGINAQGNGQLFLNWLGNCVAAARAANLKIFDSVFNNYADLDGFREVCNRAASIGVDGKMLIHPAQVDICNSVFTPSAAAVEQARVLSQTYREFEKTGRAVVGLNGEMFERLHAEIAEKTIALAQRYDGSA